MPFRVRCTSCKTEDAFPGVFIKEEQGGQQVASRSGLICTNKDCRAVYWGAPNAASCFARFFNRVTVAVRQHVKKYYDCWLVSPVT